MQVSGPFFRGMPNLTSAQSRIAFIILISALFGAAGCKDREITAYRIPKETEGSASDAASAGQPGAAGGQAGSAAAQGSSAAQPAARWEAPASWKPQPASGMRFATFLVAGSGGATADVSIITFPGTGGDDLANINRWRNQLQLQPLTAEALPGELRSLDGAAGKFVIADFNGTSAAGKVPTRILGAWLRDASSVWFIKMMGPADLVETQKETFFAFLRSFTLAGAVGSVGEGATEGGAPLVRSGAAPANTNDLPPGHPALPPVAGASEGAGMAGGTGMGGMPVQAADTPSLRWRAPAGWQTKPGSAMRKGSYAVGGDAEVAVTAFPGDVGGVLANVNRWRGQVGLAPISDAELSQAALPIDVNGLHFVVIDAAGSSSRIVAALLPWQGATWFFKLTGPADAVGKARPEFLEFLKTVQAP